MEVTGKNQDECMVALHDCNEDVGRAINFLLESTSDMVSNIPIMPYFPHLTAGNALNHCVVIRALNVAKLWVVRQGQTGLLTVSAWLQGNPETANSRFTSAWKYLLVWRYGANL